MPDRDLLKKLGIQIPIIQGPMGGGFTTAELVATVCDAGGLGSLAAAYLKPEQITEDFRKIRALTSGPLNINLFAGGYEPRPAPDAEPMLAILAEVHGLLNIPPPVLPAPQADPFPAQFEAVLETGAEVFSFTFGVPSAETMKRLREKNIFTIGTATTVDEARAVEKAGADAVVAQGSEAGAHRGTFLASVESSMIPTVELTRAMSKALAIPVIASGGLMDGRDIARALEAGASAVQLGTAFLVCPEAGTPKAHRDAILNARTNNTELTRAFSGRAARGIRNGFMDRVAGKEDYILPFNQQNALTRPMRVAAAKQNNADFLSLWAGEGLTRARPLPAKELIDALVREIREANARI
jgi:nitronate monooxygenase